MKPERINPEVFFSMLDAAGIRAVDIARKLGVTRAAVSRWRAGTTGLDDRHYKALVEWATGSETMFLATHYAAAGQEDDKQGRRKRHYRSEYGSETHITVMPDYQEKLFKSFQFQLQKLVALASGAPQALDYQALKLYAQDVHGMASALAVIMTDRKETEACPDSTRAVEGSK